MHQTPLPSHAFTACHMAVLIQPLVISNEVLVDRITQLRKLRRNIAIVLHLVVRCADCSAVDTQPRFGIFQVADAACINKLLGGDNLCPLN